MRESRESTQSPPPHYQGRPGQTRQEGLHLCCPDCGLLFGARVYRAVNMATDPKLGTLLARGELNVVTCPRCEARSLPDVPLVYHDPLESALVLIMPGALRWRELDERVALLRSLADDPADVTEYMLSPTVVYGLDGLTRHLKSTREQHRLERQKRDLEAEMQAGLERRQGELDQRERDLLAREEDLSQKQEDLVSGKARLDREREALARGWSELEREREALRALSVDLQAKERAFRERSKAPPPPPPPPEPHKDLPRLPDEMSDDDNAEKTPADGRRLADLSAPAASGPPQDEVDAFRASDRPVKHLLHRGTLYLLARPGAQRLARFRDHTPQALIQLFGFEQGPLPVLVLIPGDGLEATDADMLYFPLNLTLQEDRDILVKLEERFEAELVLYDDEARMVRIFPIQAPLEKNTHDLMLRAAVQIESMGPGAQDFRAAMRAYQALGPERLGRKQHNFSTESFQEIPSPAAARLALGIVSYWSEPENQDYLILVKSFPVSTWREIRLRVVRRAMDFGLALSPPLWDFALEEKLASSREELLRSSLASFAEVSLRIKPSDLDPQQEWENWKTLLADCVVEGVQVDAAIEELAAAAAKRAGPVEDEAAAGDLSLLSEDELLPLLTEREMRRDAALELCERGDGKYLEAVYNAVCNMTRAEVARVLPSLIQFGERAVPLLIQGLRHRKSFVRQGAALALGAIKAESGLEPLIDLLLSEPTNVWREAARAVGDMGPMALGALIAGIKTADGEGRERIAWALAQGALGEGGRAEVEAMAKGKNSALAKVASRALDVLDRVQVHDKEVRGGQPLSEQTIVRSFTRRFFEALAGEVSELSEEYIVEQEDVLDETDILEEGPVDDDDDLLDSRDGKDRDEEN